MHLLPSCLFSTVNTSLICQKNCENALLHFFDAIMDLAPTWFTSKFKMHLLAHVVLSITRFCLLKCYHEEPFESHNTVMRNASIFSNRQAPSRDIGHRLERVEGLRHIISGGFYKSPSSSGGTQTQWTSAAPAVLAFMNKCPALNRAYGIVNKEASVKCKTLSGL